MTKELKSLKDYQVKLEFLVRTSSLKFLEENKDKIKELIDDYKKVGGESNFAVVYLESFSK